MDAPSRRTLLSLAAAVPAAGALAACEDGSGGDAGEDIRSEVTPLAPGPVEDAHGALAPFTAALLPEALSLAGGPNLVCSPASALIALAMAGAGAAGETRSQMEQVLGGSMQELGELSAILRTALEAIPTREEDRLEDPDLPQPDAAQLANGVWLAEGLDVQRDYLDDLAASFDAGIRTADFADDAAREQARAAMNSFVEDVTEGMIQELVPADSLSALSRLVLINALHLAGPWCAPLTEAGSAPFHAEAGDVEVPMLTGSAAGWYEDPQAQATMLSTYDRDLGLVLVRPASGIGPLLESWSDDPLVLAALIAEVAGGSGSVDATLPGFDLASSLSLGATLAGMGMVDAFSELADFSGITASEQIGISEVLQKATMVVDQDGMEAAAATAVLMEVRSAPMEPRTLVLDVPFVALAISTSTLAPLVVAVVGDPSGE